MKILQLLTVCLLYSFNVAQAQITIENNAIIHIEPDGLLYVIPDVVDPIAKIGDQGGIFTADETAVVVIQMPTDTFNYTVPFVNSNNETIRFVYRTTVAPTTTTPTEFSSWETDVNNIPTPLQTNPVPAPLQTTNRFWRIANAPDGVATILQFTYSAQDLVGTNVIPELLSPIAWSDDLTQWQWLANSSTSDTINRIVEAAFNDGIAAWQSWSLSEQATGLPIQLLQFRADCQQEILQWTTAVEINNREFLIQGTDDGLQFENILQTPGAGNSSTIRSYERAIPKPRSAYYRLCQIDWDGTVHCFPLIAGCPETPPKPILYPNPNDGRFRITLTAESMLEIWNSIGQQIWVGSTDRTDFDFRGVIAAGSYVAVLKPSNQEPQQFRFNVFK